AVEHAGVGQFELRIRPATAAILVHQPRIRKFALRIFVKRLEIGMGGCRIEIKILLLHILAVIALRSADTEQSLFQNRVFAVPQRDRETEPAFAVGDAEQAVLAPPVRAAAGMVMWKIIPTGSRGRIVLTNSPHCRSDK